ncbi:ribosome-binding factor A [Tyzzerella sp. An114]|uniref:30S ribosome-binding factor RbfA n=1 Tax=Tyzzerella sp. An114 TaxID=1965545 RepID=UPI000B45530B|nr:30S ribosome-binding factor RbfA [Tyzzerella sp. An114]OUQ55861.1 ribosome-binding factor A [Tyzzerella sp. An114]HIT72919.1 30S ribosome-binding factor RbfA [Candidatus Fimicola cottocaccae]
MKNNNRMTRINDEILKELSQILRSEIKDPRVGVMTSVLRVDTTPDLKYCKAYISVLGNDDEKASVMKGLKNATGFIRRLLAQRVNLRNTPELIFKLDDSVEYSIRMSKLIDEISKNNSSSSGDDEDNE